MDKELTDYIEKTVKETVEAVKAEIAKGKPPKGSPDADLCGLGTGGRHAVHPAGRA